MLVPRILRIWRWRSWLRHCATSWKVASSIPDVVIGIFHRQSFWPYYGPGIYSVSNRNEYQEYFLQGGGRRPVHRADNLTTFMCRMSWNLGDSTSWNPQGLSRPVMGLLYLLIIMVIKIVKHGMWVAHNTSKSFVLQVNDTNSITKERKSWNSYKLR